ncbi:Transposase [Serratia fonticola AU-AP2C]|nr:Transposase [Serratia fonticola AU-AP2C]
MTGFKSFHRAQTILAGIEIIHILRKGQLQHPADNRLSPANNFMCWLPKKTTAQFLII